MDDREQRSDALSHGHRRARRPSSRGRLVRSRQRLIGGVAGGIADFVGAGPVTLRWLWALSLPLTGGLSAAAYLALCFLLPLAPADDGPVSVASPPTG